MIDRYFDYAAATPVSDEVVSAMTPFFSHDFYNPSALYTPAISVREAVKHARGVVAQMIGARSQEIIFTSGCTEADNLAIHGVMRAYPKGKLLISAIEHDAVRVPAKEYDHELVPVDSCGVVDVDALTNMIDDSTVLVSVMYVNNEIGTVQPLRKISQLIQNVRVMRGPKGLPLYIHTDAAQAPNTCSVNLSTTGVDLMSLSGAKIYGPKGVGCLYVRSGVKLLPQISGGGQESGFRSGTEHVANIVGFSTALQSAGARHVDEYERLSRLMEILAQGLEKLGGNILALNTPSIVAVDFPGVDAEYLLYELDKSGYMIASGSACHARSGERSHVLSAIGRSDERANSTIRLSLGRYSNARAIKCFCRDLQEVLAKHKA